MILRAIILVCAGMFPALAWANPISREDILSVAKSGWTYELRTTMRRPGSEELVASLNARTMVGSTLCMVGEPPDLQSQKTIDAFAHLMALAFGTSPRMVFSATPEECIQDATILLRFFSTSNPTSGLNRDLILLNERFGLRMGRVWQVPNSPAQAQTLFGTKGAATHILVNQAGGESANAQHVKYYRSILTEELFQSFTFGMDILYLSKDRAPFSKLHEVPNYTQHLFWRSDAFIDIMLRSGPSGLCAPDLVILAALGRSSLTHTNTSAFTDFIEQEMNALLELAKAWQGDRKIAILLDPECQDLPQ